MRKLKTTSATEEKIEAFASGSDPTLPAHKQKVNSDPDSPQAAHNYCSINLGLNRYEKSLLDELSKLTGRSRLNVLRAALIEYGKSHQ